VIQLAIAFQPGVRVLLPARAGTILPKMKKGVHKGPQQTPLNSGAKTFPVAAHKNPKPMQVDVSDPHRQAKFEQGGFANTSQRFKRSKCSALNEEME
jgi:hypothetical protein